MEVTAITELLWLEWNLYCAQNMAHDLGMIPKKTQPKNERELIF